MKSERKLIERQKEDKQCNAETMIKQHSLLIFDCFFVLNYSILIFFDTFWLDFRSIFRSLCTFFFFLLGFYIPPRIFMLSQQLLISSALYSWGGCFFFLIIFFVFYCTLSYSFTILRHLPITNLFSRYICYLYPPPIFLPPLVALSWKAKCATQNFDFEIGKITS